VDLNYIDFYGIELTKGRNFLKDMATDKEAFILNETAVKKFGLDDPIGKKFSAWNFQGTIIGVMKDYNFTSLHLPIEPLALNMTINSTNNLALKVPGNYAGVQEALSVVKDKYGEYFPGYPFEYSFLEENIGNLYETEKKLGQIFNYFTFIAIFIACLGLYGLSLYMAEQRTKEIGIRKVLGSSIPAIVTLLSKGFVKWILLANCVALPVAYFTMTRWLQNFAYRIHIGIGPFIFSASLTLFIALLTVSIRSVRASLADPVDSLRHE
jgi:putative ABC transport system permease protein